MKKLLLIVCLVAFTYNSNAQVNTPQPSPFSKIEQKVGLTDVTLEFSRPGMKGRTIFGDLVPFGKLWRTGANANTKITFSTDVTVNGQNLKAGSYAIYTIPNKDSWEVIFYSDAKNWGTPRTWDDAKVAAKAKANVIPMPVQIETYTMSFDDLTNNSAVIGILWEKTYVGIQFETPTDKTVMASINKTMNGPSANDYYAAAVYYKQEGKDMAQAVKWIDKAIDLTKDRPRFWYYRQQSLIYAKAGDKKGAIAAAKTSLKLATKEKNADYVKMNKASLKEWGAM